MRGLLTFLALLAASGPALAQSGGPYTISSSVIAGGGGSSTGGTYALSGTAGQPDASGALTGGSYSLTGGFWPRIATGLRGDANADGAINVSDVFHLINAIFAGGPPAASPCAGDANNDGSTNVSDVFFLINDLFAGGPAPSPPDC